jgi:predicted TIM-barrel fold metal-dependent hydrolase
VLRDKVLWKTTDEDFDEIVMTIDVDKLVAIDVHTHAERNPGEPQDPVTTELLDAAAEYFGGSPPQPTAQEVADYYRERSMAAIVFNVDDEAGMGRRRLGNDDVLAVAEANPDVLIPFGSVDPHKGKLGVREACELIERGVRGFKFHPNIQAFAPDDRAFYPLYETIAEAGLIALFHSGTTGIGAGMPGGGGVKLKYSNPIFVDDVAADFPELDIILAHPSFPWQEEALAVATHKPNVYIDLSGWSPKYFPEILVQYINTRLKHKMLFGSDYPLITPDRWLADFEKLPIREEVRPLVLKENAARLLGLRR